MILRINIAKLFRFTVTRFKMSIVQLFAIDILFYLKFLQVNDWTLFVVFESLAYTNSTLVLFKHNQLTVNKYKYPPPSCLSILSWVFQSIGNIRYVVLLILWSLNLDYESCIRYLSLVAYLGEKSFYVQTSRSALQRYGGIFLPSLVR